MYSTTNRSLKAGVHYLLGSLAGAGESSFVKKSQTVSSLALCIAIATAAIHGFSTDTMMRFPAVISAVTLFHHTADN
jgi:hypothetical protein